MEGVAGPWGQGTGGDRPCTEDPQLMLFKPRASTEVGVQEAPSVPRQKPAGAQDRKGLQKVRLFSDVTLSKHLGTNSRGRKWSPLL